MPHKTHAEKAVFIFILALFVFSWSKCAHATPSYLLDGLHAVASGPDGTLYIGGLTVKIGTTRCSNIAKWNGKTWTVMGAGLDDNVLSIALGKDGAVYAGGLFEHSGTAKINRVARWDGASWNSMGKELVAVDQVLVAADGSIFALGTYALSSNVMAGRVVKYANGRWNIIGENFTPTAITPAPDGTLYACGYMDNNHERVVYKSSGMKWDRITTDTKLSSVTLAIDQHGSIYASGYDGASGSIKKWDGTSWTVFAKGDFPKITFAPDGAMYAIKRNVKSQTEITSELVRWNGSKWDVLTNGKGNYYETFDIAQDGSIYIVGNFSAIGKVKATDIAKWNGSRWSALDSNSAGQGGPQNSLEQQISGNLHSSIANRNDIKKDKNDTGPSTQKANPEQTAYTDSRQELNKILGNWYGEFALVNSNGTKYRYTVAFSVYADPAGTGAFKFKQDDTTKFDSAFSVHSCTKKNSSTFSYEGDVVYESGRYKFIQKKLFNPECSTPGVQILKLGSGGLEVIDINGGILKSGLLKKVL